MIVESKAKLALARLKRVAELRLVRSMARRSFVSALIAAILVSCDQGTGVSEVSVGGEGYVSGSDELGGRVSAVVDKGLYPAMEMAVENGEVLRFGSFYEHEPWFALGNGDRIRLLEVDLEQGIGRVEVLSGFCAGETCWLSLGCVRHD